jgi:hypothetical protein
MWVVWWPVTPLVALSTFGGLLDACCPLVREQVLQLILLLVDGHEHGGA